MSVRKQNTQTIAWFWDLYKRGLLDIDPPYQRRSVWNIQYKEFFIDTVLQNFPAPAIFLHEEIKASGVTQYSVVDGKQRLLSIFEFLDNAFPTSTKAGPQELRGLYFESLRDESKAAFYRYSMTVEYLPTTDSDLLNDIFDRINRNVVKLTPQELRHARFDGPFIATAERLSEWLLQFSPEFPRITLNARNQMKDVEFVASLLLLVEEGPRGYSTSDLDKAFAERDFEWEAALAVEELFRDAVRWIKGLLESPEGEYLKRSRLRNQADFYSLFGAVKELLSKEKFPSNQAALRLAEFTRVVESDERRAEAPQAQRYFDAARSASNDPGPRSTRIKIIKEVLEGA